MNELIWITDHPLITFAVSLVLLWLAAWFGRSFLRPRYPLEDQVRDDFGIILPASLTLLGLIVGFSFSMAMSRYDQRKNYEEAKANAIGTEYLRADLLPSTNAVTVKSLLRKYLDERIRYYLAESVAQDEDADAQTMRLQSELWSQVSAVAAVHSNPTVALAVSGMNDVLKPQGYTQSAWWYRIPVTAWVLMVIIAVGCNVLVGYGSRAATGGAGYC